MIFPRFLTCLAIACLCACASAPPIVPSPQPADQAAVAQVPERYVTAPDPGEELDSLATWGTPEGRTWLFASAKGSHRVLVYDADSGALLRSVGGRGKAPGRFDRPNGLAVFADLLFVVERDNHRVQVLSLPGLSPVAEFGADVLRSPYGIWLRETAPGALDAYVTDSFMYGKRYDVVPPLAELSQRVRRFKVDIGEDGQVRAQADGSFGDTSEANGLRIVESIAGDVAFDRLLVADESTSDANGERRSTLREYTLDGRFTGKSLPGESFQAEAEGVALWDCTPDSGYWIAVDQLSPLTVFHVFDRATLKPVGSFEGKVTAYTDGIALHAAATPAFPGGALYAVHDDKAVAAFDLREVAGALGLARECVH